MLANKYLAWFLVVGYMVLIFFLSSQSTGITIPPFHADKLAHFIEYGILSTLLVVALAASGLSRNLAMIAILVSALFGFSDEIHQSFVPTRECSVLDWVADVCGACVGALLVLYLKKRARTNDEIKTIFSAP